jgi:hypothetical protein
MTPSSARAGQLQDQVRKLQGQVKHYDGAPIRD